MSELGGSPKLMIIVIGWNSPSEFDAVIVAMHSLASLLRSGAAMANSLKKYIVTLLHV